MAGVAVGGIAALVVVATKVAVGSRVSGAVPTVLPFAVKVTVPEGTPGGGSVVPLVVLRLNCPLRVVVPMVVVGVGVAVNVPALGTGAVTVSVMVVPAPLQ